MSTSATSRAKGNAVDDDKDLLELLQANKQRLHTLELQAAKKGNSVEPQILSEIEEIREKIKQLEAQRRQSVAVIGEDQSHTYTSTSKDYSLTIVQGEQIFKEGIKDLETMSHEQVLIFAPTGVWEIDEMKRDWFKTIAGCLAHGLKKVQVGTRGDISTTLNHFIGVYGLPQAPKTPRGDNSEEWDEFTKKINDVEDLLMPFNKLSTAQIYYIPVETNTIPGIGVIVIDDCIFVGFAVSGRHKVDYGIFVPNSSEIAIKIERWFSNHLKDIAINYPIQDMKRNTCVLQGMDNIRTYYGIPEKHKKRSKVQRPSYLQVIPRRKSS